jgi:hypothetical protein
MRCFALILDTSSSPVSDLDGSKAVPESDGNIFLPWRNLTKKYSQTRSNKPLKYLN